MSIQQIFSSEVAVKVFYAYLAATLGLTGVDAAKNFKPDVMTEKIVAVEKRLERMENLIIDVLKRPSS